MPTINVDKKNYKEIQERAIEKLKKDIQDNPQILKKNMIQVTFNDIITELLNH